MEALLTLYETLKTVLKSRGLEESLKSSVELVVFGSAANGLFDIS